MVVAHGINGEVTKVPAPPPPPPPPINIPTVRMNSSLPYGVAHGWGVAYASLSITNATCISQPASAAVLYGYASTYFRTTECIIHGYFSPFQVGLPRLSLCRGGVNVTVRKGTQGEGPLVNRDGGFWGDVEW